MASKAVRKTYRPEQLFVDLGPDGNSREKDNYDLPSMKAQIIAAERIIQPLVVEKVEGLPSPFVVKVLAGNRRAWSAQELVTDPHISVALRDNLMKIEVIEYTGLSLKERLEYIFDQGTQRTLGRTEVVKAVVRLYAGGMSEKEINNQLFACLANYTGKTGKINELPSNPKEREEKITKWFHGTTGNFILAAAKMGDYVYQQFILTHRSQDGLLKDGEVVEMRCSRERITALSQAKTADGKSDAGWDRNKGGEKFNALIEQFKAEDRGEKEKETVKRPSIRDLKERADLFSVPAIRKAFMIAAGEQGDQVGGLLDEDAQIFRDLAIFQLLVKFVKDLPDPFGKFVQHLLHDAPEKVEEFLTALCAK